MKRIFTLIYAFTICLISQKTSAQRDLTIHFLPKINQSNYTNPAFIPENNINIGLPIISSFSTEIGLSALKAKDLIGKGVTKDSIDLNYALNHVLQKQNYISADLSTDLLAVKFKVKGLYFGVNVTEHFSTRFSFPKDLIDLAYRGNGPFVDQNVPADVGVQFNATHYREYGLSGALKIKKFTVGARLKYLQGLANFNTSKSELSLYTSPEDYSMTFKSNYLINSSLPDTNNLDPVAYITNMQNKGMGIDLGGVFDLNDRFSFSASIVDLGFIKWNSNTTSYSSDTSFTFKGVTISNIMGNGEGVSFDKIIDTLKGTFTPVKGNGPYTTYLTTRTYLSGTFKLTQKDKFGLLFYSEYFKTIHPRFTLAYNRDFGRWFTGAITYTAFANSYANLGLGTAFKLGPLQFYVVQDNILGAFYPYSTNNLSMRMGLNLVFGYPKKKKDEKKDEKKEDTKEPEKK